MAFFRWIRDVVEIAGILVIGLVVFAFLAVITVGVLAVFTPVAVVFVILAIIASLCGVRVKITREEIEEL